MPANQPTIDVNEADRATLLRVLPYSVVERVLAARPFADKQVMLAHINRSRTSARDVISKAVSLPRVCLVACRL